MSYPENFHSIFARNCEIRRIDKQTAGDFLNSYHRYGDCIAAYRYGFYVKRYSGSENREATPHPYPVGTLVAVGTFSKARRWKKDGGRTTVLSYEWLRYASLPEVRVLGGMGRLLDTFVDEHHPDDIMTYAPLEHFSGETYEALGFVKEGVKVFEGGAESAKFRLKLTDYK